MAAADQTGGSSKQYCKMDHTKSHDLQYYRQAEQLAEKNKVEYGKRVEEKANGADGSSKK